MCSYETNDCFYDGNNFRTKLFFKKFQENTPIRIVFLGGSITESNYLAPELSFPHLFCEKLKNFFPNHPPIHYYNLGLSGTDSHVGLHRAITEVLPLHPDLVFLDYSINDMKHLSYQMAYESMVARLLDSDPSLALYILLFRSDVSYSCEGYMTKIGKHYNVPTINIGKHLFQLIEKNKYKWKSYSDDYAHPNCNGQVFITDFIWTCFLQLLNLPTSTQNALPSTGCFSNKFMSLEIHPYRLCTWKSPFTFEATFQSLFITYKQNNQPTVASIDVFIDDTYIKTIDSFSINGWPRPISVLVAQDLEQTVHKVKMRTIPCDRKKPFPLLSFSYC